MSFLPALKWWLSISAGASLAGWLLSAAGHLDKIGYVVFGLAAALLAWFFQRKRNQPATPRRRLTVLRKRFSHFFPGAFALLCLLILLGGVLYPPTNHTAVTYRIPRVLHWLAEGHWHWIQHTENYRMNNRACGIEWLSAPLLLFFRSDRLLFVLNFVPFLLMPGLIFSLFARIGVRRRVAWYWMWILPTGYNFVLQAGSTGNDTFPTIYALAAVDFACRAWVSRKPSDLWFSALAAALLTGAKASNLPLLLPWFIPALALWRVWFQRPVGTAAALVLAAVVSFLPSAVLNIVYCGTWSGLNLERPGMEMKNPLVGVWGNGLLFLLHNFVPPFFPAAGWWNRSALTILPQPIVKPLVANFEQSFHQLWEMPSEDWVGLGFGVSVLLLVSWLAARMRKAPATKPGALGHKGLLPLPPGEGWGEGLPGWLRKWIIWSSWVALLAFCVKSGMVTGARLISPYYPLLAPALLLGPGQACLVQKRWWKCLAAGVVLLVFPILIVTPGRPLWPAETVLSRATQWKPETRLIGRALQVYRVYSIRSDPMPQLRAVLPARLDRIGFVGAADDTDLSLWRPFQTRKVEHLLCTDSAEQIRARHIGYALVGSLNLRLHGMTIEGWLGQTRAEMIGSAPVTVKIAEGPQIWYIVRFRD